MKTKNLDKSDWIAISAFLLTILLLALWSIDVSVSALLANGFVSNGFFLNDPTKVYHIGLYIIILVQFANFLIILHITSITKDDSKKDES
ncbi:MAG: hypothetical protein KGY67_07330 [Candidatus Thermoplasmatota archaeon]|nr:hypothetical protein [Candidatus Thermoplasmatota archaeon]